MSAPRRTTIVILALVLLAFWLRVYRLDFVPLRGDEAFTVLFVDSPFAEMMEGIRTVEPNPPLYYLILYTTVRLFGTGDFAARYVSVIFGVLAVPLLYQLARRLLTNPKSQIPNPNEKVHKYTSTQVHRYTRYALPVALSTWVPGYLGTRVTSHWTAILAALLLAINPYQIWHSQDVRNYTLWPALSLLSLYLMLRALDENRPTLWAAYAGAALLSLYTHYYELFVLLFENLFVLIGFWILDFRFWIKDWFPGSDRLSGEVQSKIQNLISKIFAPLRFWLGAQAAIAALYLPWLVFGSSRPLDYVDKTDVPGLWGIFEQSMTVFTLGETVARDLKLLMPLFLLLAAAGLLAAWRSDRRTFTFLLLYLAIPTLGVFLLAQWRPLFRERYLNVIAPGYYLTYALALAAIATETRSFASLKDKFLGENRFLRWRQMVAGVVLGGILVATAFSLQDYYFNPQHFKAPDWRGLARHLEAVAGPRDVIIQNYPDPGLQYYYHGPARRLVLPDRSAVDTVGDLPVDRVQTGARLVELLTTHDRLWLLPQRSSWDPEGFVENWLTRRAHKLSEERAAGFRLVAFERAPAQPPPVVPYPVDARLGDGIRLLGYDLTLNVERSTFNIQLTLYWQSLAPVSRPYTIFTHLLDASGQIRAQQDQQPQAGRLPTTDWLPGDIIRDEYTLTLSPDAPPGEYLLEVGMYYLETMERLPVFDAAGQPKGDNIVLTKVKVE